MAAAAGAAAPLGTAAGAGPLGSARAVTLLDTIAEEDSAASEEEAEVEPAPPAPVAAVAPTAFSESFAKAAALPGLNKTCLVIFVTLGAVDEFVDVPCWLPVATPLDAAPGDATSCLLNPSRLLLLLLVLVSAPSPCGSAAALVACSPCPTASLSWKLSLFLIRCTAGELAGFVAVAGAAAAAVAAAENSPGAGVSNAAARFVRLSAAGANGARDCSKENTVTQHKSTGW